MNFSMRKGCKHGEWWNGILAELVLRGWSIKKLGHHCGISIDKVHALAGWNYPPTERMLIKLERGLVKERDKFWKDWERQQTMHLNRLRYS